MSSDKTAGQWVGTIVGAALTAYTGNPIFLTAGMAIGGLIDPPKGPTIRGPRLEDLSVQSAQYGSPLARIYGTVGVMGTVIWVENNKIKEKIKKKKQGGKGGGGGSTVETYSYSGTFAIALGDAPAEGVSAILRVWVGPNLIYNAGSDDLETIIASNAVASIDLFDAVGGSAPSDWRSGQKFKFYSGRDDQMPDPRIEAEMGVGNAPAYRGTPYIVFYDLPLAKYGNSLMGAQVKVELVSSASSSSEIISEIDTSASAAHDHNDSIWPVMPQYIELDAGKFSIIATETTDLDVYRQSYSTQGAGRLSVSSFGGLPSVFHKVSAKLDVNSTAFDGYYAGQFYAYVDGLYYYQTTGSHKHVVKVGGFVVLFNSTEICIGYGTPFPTLFPESAREDVVDLIDVAIFGGEIYGLHLNGSDELFVRVYDDTLSVVRDIDNAVLVEEMPLAETSNAAIFVDGGEICVFSSEDEKFVFIGMDGSLVDSYDISATGFPSDAYVRHGMSVVGRLAAAYSVSDETMYFLNLESLSTESVGLDSVVLSELARSELITPADIDVADLASDTVRGYRPAGVQQVRSCIGPLQLAYPFDLIMDGYRIKAVRRGAHSSVATIPAEYLDARAYGDAPGIQFDQQREMDSQLPRQVVMRHIDAEREYEVNEQRSAERMSAQTVDVREIDLALVLTPDEAAQIADVEMTRNWLERVPASFRLPPEYLHLQPADVVTVETDYGSFELLLGEIGYTPDGRLECASRPNAAASYTSPAVGGQGPVPDGEIPLTGDAITVLLDIPLIRNIDDEAGFAAAMAGESASWPGGGLFRSNDGEQTWADVQAWVTPVTMGAGRDPLPEHDGLVIDRTNTLTIDLDAGELEGITESQMMTGLNWFAYGADGRWELGRFSDHTLNADGSSTISTIARGLRGSEWATGLHEYGDSFVLLDDPDVMAIGADIASLNVVRQWRGISVGQTIDDAESIDFAYKGENLRPLSGVHGAAELSGADWLITWDPRTRLQGSWWKTGVALPVGEATESYLIEILDGSDVVRRLTASTPTVTYTEAQQIEDFGSAQPSISCIVYQISASVGRGRPLEIAA